MTAGDKHPHQDRRADPALTAIRAYWPIILTVIGVIITSVQLDGRVKSLEVKQKQFGEQLSLKAFTEFTEWKTNVTRDIQNLQNGCRK